MSPPKITAKTIRPMISGFNMIGVSSLEQLKMEGRPRNNGGSASIIHIWKQHSRSKTLEPKLHKKASELANELEFDLCLLNGGHGTVLHNDRGSFRIESL